MHYCTSDVRVMVTARTSTSRVLKPCTGVSTLESNRLSDRLGSPLPLGPPPSCRAASARRPCPSPASSGRLAASPGLSGTPPSSAAPPASPPPAPPAACGPPPPVVGSDGSNEKLHHVVTDEVLVFLFPLKFL